ncbi:C-GCAxxG-C-C family (seleno)protein [Labilibaculum euxinus]|uniref:C_GCAxxG_C_C family protein n=1 Tax=Labilibaculum euxinus TaxID=2686357 RepID=A0A7M4DAU6_9BACT|nr:C-GCAxxG-C-C family (seleno)protein [Labilibaculum euxinus]MUP39775.1 hypothetical protein [Labilibaculum euxinus]MVB08980.1 hypothetical protein [Labilibaculum euxinus]
MSFSNKDTKADIALKYFHKPPGYYNCAQAIYKAFQEEFRITNDEINESSKDGNGKAKGGNCGAYHAALELLKDKPELLAEFTRRFQEKSEYLTCFDIKFNYSMSCKNLVRLASDLLEELTPSSSNN